jgi:hypothetical protein
VISAIIVGGVPFGLSLLAGVGGHQLVSAIGLSLLCLALAKDDAWVKGIATIALTFLAHSVLVIAFARQMPDTVQPLLPGAEDYWQKQVLWIESGQDPEYELSAWVPAHFMILLGTTLYSFTSFGVLAFYAGFQQVDMMNFYNARLMAHSISEPTALGFGWHFWSILRGLGYLFITFEVLSFSLQCCSGRELSAFKTRCTRWSIGLMLLLADGVVKFCMLEAVRLQLFSNLS